MSEQSAKRLFQIRHRDTGGVLFELRCGSLRRCLESGVRVGIYLSGAYLSFADLTGADLSCADLSRADLSETDLSGANLSGTDLSEADLTRTRGVIALGYPNGWHAFAYLYNHKLMLRVGCRTKPLAAARDYWSGKYERREVVAALDYAEKIANLRGWEYAP